MNRRSEVRSRRSIALALTASAVAGALGLAACGSGTTTPADLPTRTTPVAAVAFPADQKPVESKEPSGGTGGLQFVPWADIEVSALGYYDHGQDGLRNDHKVVIYDSYRKTVTPTVSDASELDGLFRYRVAKPENHRLPAGEPSVRQLPGRQQTQFHCAVDAPASRTPSSSTAATQCAGLGGSPPACSSKGIQVSAAAKKPGLSPVYPLEGSLGAMHETAFAGGRRIGVGYGATPRCRCFAASLTIERVRRPEGGTALSAYVERTEEIDPGVLAAAVRGDDEAFVSVMRHYDRRLRIVAYHVVGNRQLMDDVLQEVTLRVYRSLSRFRGDSSLGTWLCRITYRASCDAVARADRLYPLPPDDLPEPRDCEPDLAETLATRAALADAFAVLPPEQRLAVLLVDREGYDYATTAEILDVPPGTLASRLSAARAKLRGCLTASLGSEVR